MDGIQLHNGGVWLLNGETIARNDNPGVVAYLAGSQGLTIPSPEDGKKQTMAYGILSAHNTSSSDSKLKIKFDAIASHDITYVGIIQTARASGLEKFPLPYVLTNCHNSLCAVGGTINEDDHVFGLSAAKKYGGEFVPAHLAVIHQYMREMYAGCGRMILGSDSHTRYGALGTLAIGEGGPELVKQLLNATYDIDMPEVVCVHLTGAPVPGVGPQDVALSIIGAVFANGFVKNSVMEFTGEGITALNPEFRNGIDVMTTETTCLSSIWTTDNQTKDFLTAHGRPDAYKEMQPGKTAYYDRLIMVDLSKIRPVIALPFHPSNVYTIEDVNEYGQDILRSIELAAKKQLDNPNLSFNLTSKHYDGKLHVDQGIIAGCAGGTYDNLVDAAHILHGKSTGADNFWLSVYPSSQPIYQELVKNGVISTFMECGATVRTAFCGPCFGAGDVPANGALSIRHSTRNFPNREGSKPGQGQISSVALMDARSIAATAANGGVLTSATEFDFNYTKPVYIFNQSIYDNRCYHGVGKAETSAELVFGPNIADWPAMIPLTDNILLRAVSVINDAVTTTDELIPSGETSSYRSNPLKLAEFTLSRKDPGYVGRAKDVQSVENDRREGSFPAKAGSPSAAALKNAFSAVASVCNAATPDNTGIGSVVYAVKPGDGSAREQAASCQKVLGGWANIAVEYATKRYRSNLINWGMLPLLIDPSDIDSKSLPPFGIGDFVFIPGIKGAIASGTSDIPAYVIKQGDAPKEIMLHMAPLTDDEKQIILSGCLINFNRR